MMAQEIEHKYQVVDDSWMDSVKESQVYSQSYLSDNPTSTVRVRVAGEKAFLTIKGASSGAAGISRAEFEYEIPVEEAQAMLESMAISSVVTKTRHLVEHEGKIWEVDVFSGVNEGLVVAELEIESEDEAFSKPSWAGKCLDGLTRCYNSQLAKYPYSQWTAQEKHFEE